MRYSKLFAIVCSLFILSACSLDAMKRNGKKSSNRSSKKKRHRQSRRNTKKSRNSNSIVDVTKRTVNVIHEIKDSPLNRAIVEADLQAIEDNHIYLFAKDGRGRSPLQTVLFTHGPRNLMIDDQSDRNILLEYDRINVFCALIETVKRHYPDLLDIFVNEVFQFGKKGAPAVHIALSNGYFDIFKLLVELGADITKTNSDGRTLLHAALFIEQEEEREEIIRFILDAIENGQYCMSKEEFLNVFGKIGGDSLHTALNVAISQGYIDIVELLINAGADVTAYVARGETAFLRVLFVKGKEKRKHIFEILLRAIGMNIESQGNKEEMLNALIIAPDGVASTLLHIALTKKYFSIFEQLINLGADITISDSNGQTLLFRAMFLENEKKTEKIIRMLLHLMQERQYKKNKQEFLNTLGQMTKGNFETVLHIAVAQGYVSIVELLINVGADITIADSDSHTVLHAALFLKDREKRCAIVNLLLYALERGEYQRSGKKFLDALGRMRDGERTTALHVAITCKYLDIIKCLINAGASLLAVSSKGETPLDVAQRNGNREIIRLISRASFRESLNIGAKNSREPIQYMRPKQKNIQTSSTSFANCNPFAVSGFDLESESQSDREEICAISQEDSIVKPIKKARHYIEESSGQQKQLAVVRQGRQLERRTRQLKRSKRRRKPVRFKKDISCWTCLRNCFLIRKCFYKKDT